MPIRFCCQHCQARVKVPDGSQGRRVKCPRCGHLQIVPETSDESSIPEPAELTPARKQIEESAPINSRSVEAVAADSSRKQDEPVISSSAETAAPEPADAEESSPEKAEAAEPVKFKDDLEPSTDEHADEPYLSNAAVDDEMTEPNAPREPVQEQNDRTTEPQPKVKDQDDASPAPEEEEEEEEEEDVTSAASEQSVAESASEAEPEPNVGAEPEAVTSIHPQPRPVTPATGITLGKARPAAASSSEASDAATLSPPSGDSSAGIPTLDLPAEPTKKSQKHNAAEPDSSATLTEATPLPRPAEPVPAQQDTQATPAVSRRETLVLAAMAARVIAVLLTVASAKAVQLGRTWSESVLYLILCLSIATIAWTVGEIAATLGDDRRSGNRGRR